jgi:hypothetical protein
MIQMLQIITHWKQIFADAPDDQVRKDGTRSRKSHWPLSTLCRNGKTVMSISWQVLK